MTPYVLNLARQVIVLVAVTTKSRRWRRWKVMRESPRYRFARLHLRRANLCGCSIAKQGVRSAGRCVKTAAPFVWSFACPCLPLAVFACWTDSGFVGMHGKKLLPPVFSDNFDRTELGAKLEVDGTAWHVSD